MKYVDLKCSYCEMYKVTS